MTPSPSRTPLYDWHVAHGGRMVEFGGWSMPVQYTSITAEHRATRSTVGVFDISHMGRLELFGPRAKVFLDTVTTRRVADLKPGRVRYSLVSNEAGGVLDDVLVYGGEPDGGRPLAMVVNAGNRLKILDWLQTRANDWLAEHPEEPLSIGDRTHRTAMIAVQGPKAIEVVEPLWEAEPPTDEAAQPAELRSMRYYRWAAGRLDGAESIISRTGYTGEDGFEIICDRESAGSVWERLVAAAEDAGGTVAGLGARDTLRLEAAMPLYGHELTEEIDPIQAGLEFAVNLKDRQFTGRDALVRLAEARDRPVRVGLQLEGRRVPREGAAVLAGDQQVGTVTSGTFSPTFERPLAMAYVRPSVQATGTRLAVDIRGTEHPAVVVPLPFYQRGT